MEEEHQHGGHGHDHARGIHDPTCDEENEVLYATLSSFYLYRRASHYTFTHRKRRNVYSLPSAQQEILRAIQYNQGLDRVDLCIEANSTLAEAILQSGCESFGVDSTEVPKWRHLTTDSDMDKARSTLKQFLRDWSRDGAEEREQVYGPIIRAVDKIYANTMPRCDVKILVPGAGLGRLAFDLACRGYATEGNEFSYHQLIASNFILNHSSEEDQFKLYPFCQTFSHHRSKANHLREITIPDIHPATELNRMLEFQTKNGSRGPGVYRYRPSQYFSMSAGEFVESYNTPEAKETFDCVVTCFFIDTARNLLDYLETIRNVLRPDGVWINHGPLLWHFEGADASESKDDHNNGRRDGDIRSFDAVQTNAEEAETPQIPPDDEQLSGDSRIGQSPGFSSGVGSHVHIEYSGDYPTFNRGPPSSSGIHVSHHEQVSGPSSPPRRRPSGSSGPQWSHSSHSAPRSHYDTADSGPRWNGSLEFTLEEVTRLIEMYGFDFAERHSSDPHGYINDVRSMGRYIYESEFWIAAKGPIVDDVVQKSLKRFRPKKVEFEDDEAGGVSLHTEQKKGYEGHDAIVDGWGDRN